MKVMSDECDKCGEHALECQCAHNTGDMSIRIMEALLNSPEEDVRHFPDAMMRVFTYLAKRQGWSLEKMQNEATFAIKYYYENE